MSIKDRLRKALKPKVYSLSSVLTFGRFEGRKVMDVLMNEDPRYIQGLMNNKFFTLDTQAMAFYKLKLNELETRLKFIDKIGSEVRKVERETWDSIFDERD